MQFCVAYTAGMQQRGGGLTGCSPPPHKRKFKKHYVDTILQLLQDLNLIRNHGTCSSICVCIYVCMYIYIYIYIYI